MRETRGEHVDWKAGEVTVDRKEKRRGHTSICAPGSRKNAHTLVGVDGTGRKAGCSHYQRQRRWWEATDPEKWLLFEDSILLLEGAGSQEGSKRNTWTQRFRGRGTA